MTLAALPQHRRDALFATIASIVRDVEQMDQAMERLGEEGVDPSDALAEISSAIQSELEPPRILVLHPGEAPYAA